MVRLLVALAFGLAGCGDERAPEVDLAVASDLAVSADLSQPRDLIVWETDFTVCIPDGGLPSNPFDPSTLCVGTPIDGTCIRTFFANVASCFEPVGCCECLSPGGNKAQCLWPTGSSFIGPDSIDGTGPQLYGNHLDCAYGGPFGDPLSPIYFWQYTRSTPQQHLLIDTRTNDVTCPDGTHVNIGRPFPFGCEALQHLLFPEVDQYCAARTAPYPPFP